MREFEAILAPTAAPCPVSLPEPRADKREFTLKTILAACTTSVLTSGCAGSNDLVPDKDLVGVSVGAVGHYGSGIGIPQFYVNGRAMGNVYGWGGGGGGMCCVLVRRHPTEAITIDVKWETYRSNVDEGRHHQAKIPVHFAAPPGDGSGMWLHFLPGHQVEAWYSKKVPEGTGYPGPVYPRGPAPRYAPLPGEKPQPPMQTQ